MQDTYILQQRNQVVCEDVKPLRYTKEVSKYWMEIRHMKKEKFKKNS